MASKDKDKNIDLEPTPDARDVEKMIGQDSDNSGEGKTQEQVDKDTTFDEKVAEKITKKRGPGRPRKDADQLYTHDMVEPLVEQFSETAGRILGNKWKLMKAEKEAWVAVVVPLMNKYFQSMEHSLEVNALLLLSGYVTSRAFQKSDGADNES